MKKWEKVQLTLDISKSEEGLVNYQDITQKLFKTMRACVI